MITKILKLLKRGASRGNSGQRSAWDTSADQTTQRRDSSPRPSISSEAESRNTNHCGFDGSVDIFLNNSLEVKKKWQIRFNRSGEKFLSLLHNARENQFLWNTALRKLFYLNKERELFEMVFRKVDLAKGLTTEDTENTEGGK
jgi:hypothetical protein